MGRHESRQNGIVPGLDGRSAAAGRLGAPERSLDRLAAFGPVALVVAGIAATAAWAGILGWWVFTLVRWAIG